MIPHYKAAFVGGNIGALVAVAPVVVLAVVAQPEDEGFALIGWAILAFAAGAVAAAVGGAVGTHRALARIDASRPLVTGLAYVPSAALLAMTGPGLFLAPVLARWMVCGIDEWSSGNRRAAPWQRLLLALVLSGLWLSWAVTRLGYDLGGGVGGSWMVWAVAVSAPIVLCILLLRHALAPLAVAGVLIVIGVVAAGASRTMVDEAHPGPARLAQIAAGIDVPDGLQVVDRFTVRTHRPYGASTNRGPDASMPVHILVSAPIGSVAPPLPEALVPQGDGSLRDGFTQGLPPPADEAGRQAANGWEDSLRQAGWEIVGHDLYWVARPVAALLSERGGPVYGRGSWPRAVVMPHGDGAVVFFSTRP